MSSSSGRTWPHPVAMGRNVAPGVGLEPTTNGLTVSPITSVQSQWVLLSPAPSTNSARSCRRVLPCPATYGYTFGYTLPPVLRAVRCTPLVGEPTGFHNETASGQFQDPLFLAPLHIGLRRPYQVGHGPSRDVRKWQLGGKCYRAPIDSDRGQAPGSHDRADLGWNSRTWYPLHRPRWLERGKPSPVGAIVRGSDFA